MSQSPKPLHIAIDGPVAAGKGDIAARLARKLGIVYVYTGAMYRALALACIQAGVAFKDAGRVLELLSRTGIELAEPDRGSGRTYKVLLNGTDVTERIFMHDVAQGASDVSTIPQVRIIMVEMQKDMIRGKSAVMEGRDIGLRVMPDSQIKIFLTASLEERARRRMEQFRSAGVQKTHEEVLADTKKRDLQDTTRSADPLKKLPDSWELDTTEMTQDEVVERIMDELRQRRLL